MHHVCCLERLMRPWRKSEFSENKSVCLRLLRLLPLGNISLYNEKNSPVHWQYVDEEKIDIRKATIAFPETVHFIVFIDPTQVYFSLFCI